MYGLLISIFWTIWLAYWIVSSFSVKKNAKLSGTWMRSWIFRVVIFALLIILFNEFVSKSVTHYQPAVWVSVLGVVLVAAGLAFAIWARVHLGRNWSGVPSLKVDHELVTSGPYSFVRHPIYTGATTALIGTALNANTLYWWLFCVGVSIMFILRIPVEERLMTKTFPGQYPEYKKRTKALVPFIW